MNERDLQLALDRFAIHDIIMQYWMNVDRRDFDKVKACFVPGLPSTTPH